VNKSSKKLTTMVWAEYRIHHRAPRCTH